MTKKESIAGATVFFAVALALGIENVYPTFSLIIGVPSAIVGMYIVMVDLIRGL